MNVLLGLVEWWVRLYTSGLDPAARDRRREEIAADVWEQRADLEREGRGSAAIAASVLGRALRGVPDDVAWRLEVRAATTERRQVEEGRADMNASGSRLAVTVPAVGVALAIATALAIIVIDNIQYAEGSERFLPGQTVAAISLGLLAAGLVSTVAGFLVMRARPAVGAVLAAGGAIVAGLMVYWLIVPLVVAGLVALYSVRRARRLAAADGV